MAQRGSHVVIIRAKYRLCIYTGPLDSMYGAGQTGLLIFRFLSDPKKPQPCDDNSLLGGPWDLVIAYNWAYNPTYNPPKWAYRGYPNYK